MAYPPAVMTNRRAEVHGRLTAASCGESFSLAAMNAASAAPCENPSTPSNTTPSAACSIASSMLFIAGSEESFHHERMGTVCPGSRGSSTGPSTNTKSANPLLALTKGSIR
eukprot:2270696-Rhodomonas_salina.2